MTDFVIDTSAAVDANLTPDSVVEEVAQNVRTILSTFKGQVPMDRGFGISADAMDLPIGRAMAKLKIEIVEAIQDYEPRAEVQSIEFNANGAAEGILVPKVGIRISD